MGIRHMPKLMLWMMLLLSSAGAISFWMQPPVEGAKSASRLAAEQHMAVSTATHFMKEWMTWNGAESPEDRSNRLKPYVGRSQLSRLSALHIAEKNVTQHVVATQFMTLRQIEKGLYRVRIRVEARNPNPSWWEAEVPVAVQLERGASVIDPPHIRSMQEPLDVSAPAIAATTVSSELKQRMRPTIETFVKTMCEGKDTESLVNVVATDSKLTPLQGRIRFISLDQLEASGEGAYHVQVSFTAQDPATGARFPQVWKLKVMEENQKFFVLSLE